MKLNSSVISVLDTLNIIKELECFFLVTPNKDALLINSVEGRYEKVERIGGLYSDNNLGPFAKVVSKILEKNPLQGNLDFLDDAKYGDAPLQWKYIWSKYYLAIGMAKELLNDYPDFPVYVAIIETNAAFNQEETLRKIFSSDRLCFISYEDPVGSYKLTKYLIQYERVKNIYRVKLANKKRIEKVEQETNRFEVEINEIKRVYRENHDGKNPSLNKIAEILTENGVASPSGNQKWFAKTVARVLSRFNNDNVS